MKVTQIKVEDINLNNPDELENIYVWMKSADYNNVTRLCDVCVGHICKISKDPDQYIILKVKEEDE